MKRLFFAVLVLACSAALLCGCSEDETGMYNLAKESYGNEQYAVQGVFGSNISHYDTDGSLTYDESLTSTYDVYYNKYVNNSDPDKPYIKAEISGILEGVEITEPAEIIYYDGKTYLSASLLLDYIRRYNEKYPDDLQVQTMYKAAKEALDMLGSDYIADDSDYSIIGTDFPFMLEPASNETISGKTFEEYARQALSRRNLSVQKTDTGYGMTAEITDMGVYTVEKVTTDATTEGYKNIFSSSTYYGTTVNQDYFEENISTTDVPITIPEGVADFSEFMQKTHEAYDKLDPPVSLSFMNPRPRYVTMTDTMICGKNFSVSLVKNITVSIIREDGSEQPYLGFDRDYHIEYVTDENGSFYVPLRGTAEFFGETVVWDENTGTAGIKRDGKIIAMDGVLYDDTYFVKIREMEKLGYTVDYVDHGSDQFEITVSK